MITLGPILIGVAPILTIITNLVQSPIVALLKMHILAFSYFLSSFFNLFFSYCLFSLGVKVQTNSRAEFH